MNYIKKYRDEVIIPDKYNTGCKGELISVQDFFGDLYTGGVLYITSNIQNQLGTVYENIDFDVDVNLSKVNLASMTFKNCKFSIASSYAVTTGNGSNFTEDMEVIFENCEFVNQTSAAIQPAPNIKLYKCKFHEMGGDGGKVLTGGTYDSCYFYDIGFKDGAHADGIQVTGANTNFSIVNCRFDMPYYSKYTPNAAIFFILEEDSYNSVIKDCVMTGGNYTMYYGRKNPDAESPVVLENNTVSNIVVGCSAQYGILQDNSDSFNHDEVKQADKLFVSSVYKENDKIKLLVTNYTNNEKVLTVVTNKGQTNINIPACPLCDDGIQNTLFTDFPFDVEVEVEGNYVVCYDTSVSEDNQIRYVSFDGGNESSGVANIKDLFTQICDAIREKDGTVALINHVDIPKRIQSINSNGDGITPTGTINITANGAYDVTSYAQANVNIVGEDTNIPTGVIIGELVVDNNSSSAITIQHNMAKIPSVIVIFPRDTNTTINSTVGGISVNASTNGISCNTDGTFSYSGSVKSIQNITEQSFDFVPRSASFPIPEGNYLWVAM